MDKRSQFQERLTRRFLEVQACGIAAQDAAGVALTIEAGRLAVPVDPAQLANAVRNGNGAGEQPEVRAGVKTLFSSSATLVLSHAVRQPAKSHPQQQQQQQQPGGSLQLDWRAIDATTAALGVSNRRAALLACDVQSLTHRLYTEGLVPASQLISSLGKGDMDEIGWQFQVHAAVVLCCMPWLGDPEHEDLLISLCQAIDSWPSPRKEGLVSVLSALPRQHMESLVGSKLLQFVVLRLMSTAMLDEAVIASVGLLDVLFQANEIGHQIPRTAFQCDAINTDEFDLKADYVRWRRQSFSFAAHAFMYDAASKAEILRIENELEMSHEFHDAMMASMFAGGLPTAPFFVLKVRRQHLLNDTVLQMRRAGMSLKRPLKVKFVGEDGVDEGGVKKEFFQLLTGQLLNEDFGIFRSDPDTRQLWFRSSQFSSLEDISLVGSLIGLSVYNSVILDVSFPLVLWKKLLRESVGQVDNLQELCPAVYENLLKLRSFSGDWKTLGLVFQIEQENEFGDGNGRDLVDLKENGANIEVTADNVEQYLQLYSNHILNDSIASQFGAFEKGFRQVADGPAMGLLFPNELELLVCGMREMDFHALEKSSHVEGFQPDDDVVRWFWDIVNKYDESKQRRLLSFITGSDRVPIGGLGKLNPPLVIHRNGDHSNRLPTAHTCFDVLMLPAYKDKATLERLLALAIENAEGFGLR